MDSVERKKAKEKLLELDKAVTCYQTNKYLMVWHEDGSMYILTHCYYEQDEEWIYVIPEHGDPLLFHQDDVKLVLHPMFCPDHLGIEQDPQAEG